MTLEGEVYLAHDALLQRSVTVEMPSASRPFDETWIYRRQVASALHHRNIVATLDLGDESGMPYVVTEYFVGDTLRNIIDDEAPFDVDDVAILIEQLAQGLLHAHQRGIVHGFLSPELIIVDSAGLAKITGFGLIEGQMFSETGTRAEIPSSPYLPAHLRGNSLVTQSLDVHALAAIAWEMLTGTPVSPEQGFHSPSVFNAAIPSRAGDTILHGLRSFDERSGLTAFQFSNALTHWRSWAVQNTPSTAPQGFGQASAPSGPIIPPSPAYLWPSPVDNQVRQSGDRVHTVSPQYVQRRPPVLRWLTVAAIALAIATGVVLSQSDSPDTISSVTDVPTELSRLLQSIDE